MGTLAKRRLPANIGEESENDIPAMKRRLVELESSGNNDKTIIDLTMDSESSSPTPSGSVDAAPVTIRGSSPLTYGSEGEEEEARTTWIFRVTSHP